MKLEDKIDISILNTVYGSLLTPHQREMIRLYYDCDISLFEISEQFGVSRQAVRDSLVRAEKALNTYEDKMQLVSKNKQIIKILSDANNSNDINEIKSSIKKAIDKLEE